MNRLLIVFSLVLLFSGIFSSARSFQLDSVEVSSEIKKSQLRKYWINRQLADEHFVRYSYLVAINKYKKALKYLPEDDTSILKIASSYYYMNEVGLAKKWYEKVIDNSDSIQAGDIFNYAEVLLKLGEVEKAEKQFKRYASILGEESRAHTRLMGIKNLNEFYGDSSSFIVKPVEFNSEESDFAPAHYHNGIVFASSRAPGGLFNGSLNHKSKWDDSFYLDLYYADEFSTYRFENSLNSKFHEGPLVFFDDDKKVIFTRNNHQESSLTVGREKLVQIKNQYTGKSAEEKVNLKLFYSEKSTNGHWSYPSELPFNNSEYSVGHPAITKNGQTLFFTSDMPDSNYGQTDIYYSINTNNTWSDPVNLGDKVNTSGKEMFPFISSDSVLFFASDGYSGLGGLDIYRIDLKDPEGKVENLGYPINTIADDFGLTYVQQPDHVEGYFSTNRPGTKKDDIFYYRIDNSILIKGKVIDKQTKEIIPFADVVLRNEAGVGLDSIRVGEDGAFSFEVKKGIEHRLESKKRGYSKDNEFVKKLSYSPNKKFVLEIEKNVLLVLGTIKDIESKETLGSSRIIVTNESNGQNFGLITHEDGKYAFLADPDTEYSFKVSKDSYFAEVGNVSTYGVIKGDVVKNFDLEKIVVGKPISLGEIRFDYDKSNITSNAARVLDEFVHTLTDNPTIIVELSSHTDCRGNDEYNFSLSDRRAISSGDYVISKGISSNRIEAHGYGETKLIEQCESCASCSEEQHARNRRSEFKVTGFLPLEDSQEQPDIVWIDPNYLSDNFRGEISKSPLIILAENESGEGTVNVSGQIKDKASGESIAEVDVSLTYTSNGKVFHFKTSDNGQFSFQVKNDEAYKISAAKAGYIDNGLNTLSNAQTGLELNLIKGKKLLFKGQLMDENKSPLSNVRVVLSHLTDDEEYVIDSNSEGYVLFELISNHSYQIKITSEGFEPYEKIYQNIQQNAIDHIQFFVLKKKDPKLN